MPRPGVEYKTLEPGKNGTRALVFNPSTDAETHKALERIADANEDTVTNYTEYAGRGEFLGSDTSRAEGAASYESVLRTYQEESQVPGRKQGGLKKPDIL